MSILSNRTINNNILTNIEKSRKCDFSTYFKSFNSKELLFNNYLQKKNSANNKEILEFIKEPKKNILDKIVLNELPTTTISFDTNTIRLINIIKHKTNLNSINIQEILKVDYKNKLRLYFIYKKRTLTLLLADVHHLAITTRNQSCQKEYDKVKGYNFCISKL